MEKSALKEHCEKWQSRYFQGQKAWSAVHHISVFGSVVCSIAAGALIQADQYKITATTLTAIAAALTGMAAAGGFARKWRSNRMSRSRIDGILLDLEDDSCDVRELAGQLKTVIYQHDLEVVMPDESQNKDKKPEVLE